MKMYIQFLFATMLASSCPADDAESAPERTTPSIAIAASQFRMIRGQVRFQGRNFAELALRAGMYKKEQGFFPAAERGAASVAGATWHGSSGIGLVAYHPHMKLYSVYYLQERAVPGHHVGIVYADKDYIFFSYGFHSTLKNVRPSLEVYSAKRRCFARIESVSTKGGKFGYYASELIAPGEFGPAMGWDDRAYANQERIPPRPTWPERIELRDGVFKISYYTAWKIKEFVTSIQFTKDDLEGQLDRMVLAHSEKRDDSK